MTITAKVILDSVSPMGVRLTTLELEYPRFIHSEFMTHRMFSRNASSSRAIPVAKVIKQVIDNPAEPIHWGRNKAGMQAREEVDSETKEKAISAWDQAALDAAWMASCLNELGIHKQVVNRILEPFQHIKVVVTATEWDNFFELRDHEDAQPEIAALARAMRQAMRESTPRLLAPGAWHTPYAHPDSKTSDQAIKTAVAGCARVSYNNHDGSNRTVEKDLKLYEQLLTSRHLSPFEHVATPMRDPDPTIFFDTYSIEVKSDMDEGVTHIDRLGNAWSGNFRGWIQFRQLV